MDKLDITILPDGTVKVETDKVSAANHVSAEGFIRECSKLLGGKSERKSRHKHGHHGHHHHEGEHESHGH